MASTASVTSGDTHDGDAVDAAGGAGPPATAADKAADKAAKEAKAAAEAAAAGEGLPEGLTTRKLPDIPAPLTQQQQYFGKDDKKGNTKTWMNDRFVVLNGECWFDVVVIIALQEELRAFMEGLPRPTEEVLKKRAAEAGHPGIHDKVSALFEWKQFYHPFISFPMYDTYLDQDLKDEEDAVRVQLLQHCAISCTYMYQHCHNSACLLTALAAFTAQSTCQNNVHLLAVCLGDMGQETMASATINLVRVLNPNVCINTGITGSLNDGDLKIGDVMVKTAQCCAIHCNMCAVQCSSAAAVNHKRSAC